MRHIKNSPKIAAGGVGAPAATPPVFKAIFSDPNQVSQVSGWDLDVRQIEPGPMRVNAALRQGRSFSVMGFQISRKVHQVGESPRGFVTLGIPSARGLTSWGGTEIRRKSLLGFGDGGELNSVSEAGFHGFTFSIPRHALMRLSNNLKIDIPDSLFKPVAHPVESASSILQDLAFRTRAILQPQFKDPNGEAEEDILTGLLLAATGAPEFDDKSDPGTRMRALNKALNVISNRADESVSVAEICADINVSWRTLDRAFKENFGIGPKAYLNRFRLSRARTDLTGGDDHVLVTDVANKWGFWHMGQFARDYHRLFGLLPSHSLGQGN